MKSISNNPEGFFAQGGWSFFHSKSDLDRKAASESQNAIEDGLFSSEVSQKENIS